MSYTILTVPFDLRENTTGNYLMKGFVFDDFFPEYFESKSDSSSSFLHVGEFNSTQIKLASLRAFFRLNFPDVTLAVDNSNVFKSTSFFDTKHLNSSHGYTNEVDFSTLNDKIKKHKENTENKEALKLPLDKFSLHHRYTADFIQEDHPNEILFEIEGIKLYLNQSKTSRKGIGFGFVEIILKWRFSHAVEMIESLEPFSELFRFYGRDSKNEFHIFNEGDWNLQVSDYVSGRKRSHDRLPNEVEKQANLKLIEQWSNLIRENHSFKKINFKTLIDELLNNLTQGKKVEEIFDFVYSNGSKVKPYILHLSNYPKQEETAMYYNALLDLDKRVFRMLRISGKDNNNINDTFKFEPVLPDFYIKQYILNEGAFVIEGIENSSDLLNKYYPAFIFALNQKYLFHYMQQRINELPYQGGKYSPEDLKTLQKMLLQVEFNQVFTSLSNYNEIDIFFEKLREQFKINELKDEYLASVTGISKISQIEEKRKDEEIEKIRSNRLNAILLLLTIAQVWSALYDSLPFSNEDYGWNINLGIYFLMMTIGIYLLVHYQNKEKSLS